MNGDSKGTRRGRLGAACTGAAVCGLLAFSGSGAEAGLPAPPSADLGVVKTDSADPIETGKTLTYKIDVSNIGPNDATNVVVTDKLDSKLDFVSVTTSKGTCKVKGRTVTCTIDNLVADGTDPYSADSKATITLKVKAPAKAGTISNTAEVASDVTDPNPANNTDTETTKVVAGGGGGGNVPSCAGVDATIVGTSGDDVLAGTNGRDVILARGGDDEIRSGDGNDLICAGRGADTVKAGDGRDVMRGAGGKDRMAGQAGNDKVRGQARGDRLRGGAGDDLLSGGPGEDRCRGGSGTDTLNSCEE
jgi:uncharacterized repeat protein (TIGR01451 family)